MEYISEQLEVSTCSLYGENYTHFNFIGRLTKETSLTFCSEWEREFKKPPADKKFVFIWDCSEMTGFDIAAKKQWIKSLYFHEHQISSIMVISNNILVRGAAHLMLKLFSFKSQVVQSHDEINFKIPAVA